MAELVVAKLQNKRGLERDLPQPLDPGEIGLCVDSAKMFIGAEPINGGFISLQSDLKDVINVAAANELLNNRIVQVDLGAAPLTGIFDLDDLRQIIVTATADDDEVPNEIIVMKDEVNSLYRAYLGYQDMPTHLPTATTPSDPVVLADLDGFFVGTPTPVVRRFGSITGNIAPSNNFSVIGLLNLAAITPPDFYVIADIGAVTEILNKIYLNGSSSGLANILQNLEILTAFGSAAETGLEDQLIVAATFSIDDVPNDPVTSYIIADADSFAINYSVSNGGNYNRTGTLLISSTLTPATATLSDRYSEVNPGAIAISFNAVVTGSLVVIQSTTSEAGLTFRTVTRRWLSF